MRVGTGELIAAQRALAAVDPASPGRRSWRCEPPCARGAPISPPSTLAFALWAGERSPPRDAPLIDPVATAVLPRVAIPVPSRPALAPDEEVEVRPAAWSDVELLRDKDFADYTDAERALARAIMARIARRGPRRRSRRTRPSRRRSHRPDPRATLRVSLRHAGEPFERRWRVAGERPRPLVLVCDVSGSMEPYSRMLLQYAQACVAARRRCEAFAFGTRLTPDHGRAPRPRPRPGARARRRRRRGLVRGDTDRRCAGGAQPRPRPPARARVGRRRSLRRLGPRRSRAAATRGRPAGSLRASARLAQPAQGEPRLRAAGPRDGRGAAARRRFPGRQLARLARPARGADGVRVRARTTRLARDCVREET